MSVSILPILISSCVGSNPAVELGRLQARVTLPDLPSDCRVKEPHAPIAVGMYTVSVLRRERDAHERSWERQDRCNTFYDQLRAAVK